MIPFTHLHVHSNYSFCRGANSIKEICAAAKKLKMDSIALTDTNGIYGLVWFLQTAKEYGLKPIIATEIRADDGDCVVIAKNLEGYSTLCKYLTAKHCESHFNILTCIKNCNRGVIVISSSLSLLDKLRDVGCELYAEIIPYSKAKEKLLNFCSHAKVSPVATGDVYFVEKSDWEIHKYLRAIDLNTTLTRLPKHEIACPDAYLRSPEEMFAMLPNCSEAIENSVKISKECAFNLDFGKLIFASFIGPRGEDAFSFLKKRTLEGIRWRYGNINSTIQKRLDYELEIIAEKQFAPYFLVVADIVSRAPRTCGRGSAAASLVSYCLGITHVDPIKYDLFFDRFMNPGRIDPPDIDVDFPWDERDDILDFIFRKYGSHCTAMVSNHNTFKARAAVREIAKVFGIPDNEIKSVTDKLSSYWAANGINELIHKHPIFKNSKFETPWPKILDLAEKIYGYPRHLSVHCGGVLIAPDGINHYVPTQPAKKELRLKGVVSYNGDNDIIDLPSGINVAQWEKDQTEEMGLVKIDILGNRSLAVIRDALFAVKKNYNVTIDYAKWNPLNDKKTIELIERGDTIGVFYVESPAMRLLQQKTSIGDYEHLVIHSSIIRPAANPYINEYIRRLKGGKYAPLHPLLEDLLKETYGIMVYQEDVSKVAIALADFTAAEADDLRKIISKKHKRKQMENYRKKFYSGAMARNVTQETCDKIWNMIMSFSGYSFCKPHSASYALVSFKSAYLRAHYPAEFMAAVISNQGGYYSTFAYLSESRRMGLKILMPDINKSEKQYAGSQGEIRVGLMQLKGLTSKGLDTILQERKRGLFTSFDDFINRTRLDPSDVRVLIKGGVFDELERNKTRPELMWHLNWYAAEQRNAKRSGTISIFDDAPMPDKIVPNSAEYDDQTILRQEIETLGFLLSRHPLTLYKSRLEKLNYVLGSDLHKFVNKDVQSVGWLITRKAAATKSGEIMEFMSFEDTTAIYETTFFPKTYAKFIHMMTFVRPYKLYGKVESHYGAVTLNVRNVDWL